MNNNYWITFFSSTYGSGSYNTSTYNGETQTSTGTGTGTGTNTGAGGTSGAGGTLVNTGVGILIPITLACLIIFVALIVRFWRRKPVSSAAVKTTPDAE